uniref:Uncharacterized protein n=1 Tax=Guillardia theta TaxID=55529 RepID=A0A7S4KLV1_GUITH|mmetsp:Transcript_2706/g.9090  ORF Transcript_2706/g.9090 Transcript_2706/m.9090 type:complete len:309 (+) Transcript_2706:123-1049(+)
MFPSRLATQLARLCVTGLIMSNVASAFLASNFVTRPSSHPNDLKLRRTCGLRTMAMGNPEPDTDKGPKDGSVEKMLGFLGPVGSKFGQSIDWFFDTSSVSGAKAWRLQVVPGEADSKRWRKGDELESMIQEQILESETSVISLKQLGADGEYEGDLFSQELPDSYSMADDDLGKSLTERLQQMQRVQQADVSSDSLLTGAELALLCNKKYGLYHDMALKCDKLQLVTDRKLVSVNIYYAYYGQINPRFPYSEAEYLSKLDTIANAVNTWGQAEFVRSFFAEKPTAYRGLPSRPRWDTGVELAEQEFLH